MVYPRPKAFAMAKIRLSVGLTSSSSILSTYSFCWIVSLLPLRKINDTHLAEPHKLIVNSPDGLLDSLFKSTSNTHNLPDTLHRAAQQFADARELFQIPARNLDDAVVERGFEACRRLFCDGVFDFVERDAQTKFGGDEGEGVAGCFRCERGRAGETGVNLSRI